MYFVDDSFLSDIFCILSQYSARCFSLLATVMCNIRGFLNPFFIPFFNKVIDMDALKIDTVIHILFCMFRRTTPSRVWQSMSMYF